jgi:hypothetical protein
VVALGGVVAAVAAACALAVVVSGGAQTGPSASGGASPAHHDGTPLSASPSASGTSSMHQRSPTARPDPQGWASILGPNGWSAGGSADATTASGISTFSLGVTRPVKQFACPTKAEAPHDVCTRTPLKGGTLFVDKSFKELLNGTDAHIWDLTWIKPDSSEVYAEIGTSGARQAFTVDQVASMLTDPV